MMLPEYLGSYRILGKLGAGGMGEVYRARDTKLDRDVALKILPAHLAADRRRIERFQREARALAALNHPGIVTVFSVEEADGQHFLTMELVQGRDLDALRSGEQVPLPTLLDVALQLTEALHTAHERGIVHRDLKPANVMVTHDGRVKVLDFGLAKLTEGDEPDRKTAMATEAGVVMGTAPYMSPEQVQGLPLDRRSDIFSIGIVLHELAAGERPFQGGSAAALASAILRDTPPPVTAIDPRLPGGLADVIARCLRKDPAARFQTAQGVRDALGALRSAPPVAQASPAQVQKAVAVLPFVNRSPDPDNEYFADGLTEEVIADLSRVSALRVISRNSAMALKGTVKDTATLANDLRVSHLVTGSVRRAGTALRVTAELVDARTDATIWSGKYSGTVEDVFGIQEEIARKIVAALQVTLTDTEERQVGQRPIDNVVAYDGYLRARQEMYAWTPEGTERALRLVDAALDIVGDNPLLLATKGQIHWNQANILMDPTGEHLERAGQLAARALALDADAPLGMFVRGLVAGLRGQTETALADLYRARDLLPNDANVLGELCRFANAAGLKHQGVFVDQIVRIDPLTPLTPLVVSTYHSVNGRHREAAAAARRAIAMAPAPSVLHLIAGWQIAEAGGRDEAAAILDRLGRAPAGPVGTAAALFLRDALEGDAEAALAHVRPETFHIIKTEHFARMIVDGYALIGRRDEALRWLRRAIDCGFINYPCLAEHDPFLAGLRDDAGFRALMNELKPRWEAVVEWEQSR